MEGSKARRSGGAFPIQLLNAEIRIEATPTGLHLRLVVRAPASIQYEKNLNDAKLPIEQRPDDACVCNVLLHHSGEMQSVLRLPVTDPDLPI